MSGKRQHILPRFLQRGFASRTKGDKVFAWLFRTGTSPFECNIDNIGVENQFYSTGSDSAADDAITEAEGTFSNLVASLRAAPRIVQELGLPSLIAHFEVRTRHLRQNFIDSSDYLVRGMATFLEDTEIASAYFERRFRTDPTLIAEPLAKTLGMPTELLQRFVAEVPSHVFREGIATSLPFLAAKLQTDLRGSLKAKAKDSHIRALKVDVSPPAKTDRFRNLEYATIEFPQNDMILGDSIVLFEVEGRRRYKPFLEAVDTFRTVYVPLSPSMVLAGAPTRPTAVPQDLPEAVAAASFEYFISHHNSPRNALLHGRIGENSALISIDELDAIMNEVLGN